MAPQKFANTPPAPLDLGIQHCVHYFFNLNTNINVKAYICGARIFLMNNGYGA